MNNKPNKKTPVKLNIIDYILLLFIAGLVVVVIVNMSGAKRGVSNEKEAYYVFEITSNAEYITEILKGTKMFLLSSNDEIGFISEIQTSPANTVKVVAAPYGGGIFEYGGTVISKGAAIEFRTKDFIGRAVCIDIIETN